MGLRNGNSASDGPTDGSKGNNYFAWGMNRPKRLDADDSPRGGSSGSGSGSSGSSSSATTANVATDAAVADSEVWTSWKSRRKQGVEKVVKNCIDYILYSPPDADTRQSVGVRALGALDLLSDDEVGPGFLPSPSYPSDHIAIAADVEVVRVVK